MNREQLILGPTGKTLYKMGGENALRVFMEGDYCVSMEWLSERRSCEPMMVIWSKHGGRDAGAFGICLSSIAKYADASGKPTAAAFLEAWKALPTLGRNQIDLEVYRLVDVILRHTPDLINMPPAPIAVRRAEAGEALLEITQKDINGKTHSEVVV